MINDQQFIDLIEKNPVIWDRKSKEFRTGRGETWEHLANLTGTNSIAVQKRWKSLREKYVRERKYWSNLKNRPGIKIVKQKWELCDKMHFIAPYCLPRANHSPKQGPDNDDFDADLSTENNSLPQEIREEEAEANDNILNAQVHGGSLIDKEMSFNCSPSSTMPTAIDTDTVSLTNRAVQVISSTTNQNQVLITTDDDYAESSEDEPDVDAQQPTDQQQQSDDEVNQQIDRKRKFSIFGKFIAEELISHATLDAEILYTRILSEVLNYRVRKQMRNAF